MGLGPFCFLAPPPRAPITMAGGTVIHFATEGICEALEMARAAAGDRDLRLGGSETTVREYLQAHFIDELHLAVRPVLLGSGESLFADSDLPALGYACANSVAGERANHIFLHKQH